MRSATSQPGRSGLAPAILRRAAALGIATALALLPAIEPASASVPRPGGGFSAVSRDQSTVRRSVPSVRTMVAFATAHPRVGHALPRRTVEIAHPATPANRLVGGAASAIKPRTVGTPDVVSLSSFTGLGQSDQAALEPPDPWVAVNATYLVQAINSTVRVSTRSGVEVSTFPLWLLFALPYDQSPSDPRIVWDATHGRWVASVVSFNISLSDNYLNLAVSETADPLGGWAVYSVGYGSELPDYPGLASSNDKIAISADDFAGLVFQEASLQIFDWAPILAGTTVTPSGYVAPSVAHVRPAQILSSSADLYLILEDAATGDQLYQRFIGPAAGGGFVDIADLTTSFGYSAFALPPAPRQPGGTIVDALDERPTDAIWQNGHLWWVSTYPVSFDSGITYNDAVVAWELNAQGATVTVGTSVTIAPGDGIDAYMGGIGLSRNGTLFIVYSQSSSSDDVSLRANRFDGSSLGSDIRIAESSTDYGGTRWGDYVGVAMDPVGTGAVWQAGEYVADDGTWATKVSRLVVDGDLPTNPGIPGQAVFTPSTLGPLSVPVRLAWSVATDVTSGTVVYQLSQAIDANPFETPSTTSALSLVRPLLIGHTIQFRVRAVDAVGNVGDWSTQAYAFTPTLYQQTSTASSGKVTYSGTWRRATSASFSGGSARYAKVAGASATFTATGARSIAFVTAKGSTRGSFRIYVDGKLRATIKTRLASSRYRQVVYQFGWSSPGTHKVKIVVLGTAGHPRVDVDAFVVLR